MFQDTSIPAGGAARRPLTFMVSFLSQCLLVCVALLIPLLGSPRLPGREIVSLLLSAPPPPPAPVAAAKAVGAATPREVFDKRLSMPRVMPDRARLIVDPPGAAPAWSGAGAKGIVGSVPGGVPAGAIGGLRLGALPPPPPEIMRRAPPQSPAQPSGPRRVFSGIQAAKLIRQAAPVYPQVAREARIAGTVRLDAFITADGSIQSIQVLGGHPLLVKAAVDAVKQWRYSPTLLNGEAVAVVTRIDVIFRLR